MGQAEMKAPQVSQAPTPARPPPSPPALSPAALPGLRPEARHGPSPASSSLAVLLTPRAGSARPVSEPPARPLLFKRRFHTWTAQPLCWKVSRPPGLSPLPVALRITGGFVFKNLLFCSGVQLTTNGVTVSGGQRRGSAIRVQASHAPILPRSEVGFCVPALPSRRHAPHLPHLPAPHFWGHPLLGTSSERTACLCDPGAR